MNIEKFRKPASSCYSHIKFKALNHRLDFQKVHRVIKFKQKACLKPYTAINTDLRKKSKN